MTTDIRGSYKQVLRIPLNSASFAQAVSQEICDIQLMVFVDVGQGKQTVPMFQVASFAIVIEPKSKPLSIGVRFS